MSKGVNHYLFTKTDDIIFMVENMTNNKKMIKYFLERFTKLPEKMIKNIMTERLLLSPEDCVKYGIVDELF